MRTSRFVASCVRLWSVPMFAAVAVGQCQVSVAPGLGIPGTGGIVYAQHVWDPDGSGPAPAQVLVAGEFRHAGSRGARLLAAVDPATGAWSELPNTAFYGPEIRAMVTLPSGDLVVAGYFGNTGSTVALSIARFDGQTWYPITSGTGGSGIGADVRALAVLPNGDLVAAGSFQLGGPVEECSIARWDGAQWSELGRCTGSVQNIVHALYVDGSGDLYVGGQFQAIDGVPASYVARWDGAQWQSVGAGADNRVLAITETANGELVFAGAFTMFDGVPCGLIVKQQGSSWQPLFAPPPFAAGGINSIAALPGGGLVAAGSGGTFAGASVGVYDGSSWSYPPALVKVGGAPGHVESVITLPDGSAMIGGFFQTAGGVAASNVARFDPAQPGAGYTALGTGTNGAVQALLRTSAGELYAAGAFTILEGVPAKSLARRTPAGSWQPVLPAPVGAVNHLLETSSGDLFAGGSFSAIGGVQAARIARFDGTQWSALGAGSSIGVNRLVEAPNGDLIARGWFSTAAGFVPTARWDGATWQAFGDGDPVQGGATITIMTDAIATLEDGDLVAVASVSGSPQAGTVVRWDGLTWTDYAPGLPFGADALVVLPGGRLVCGSYYWDGGTWTQTGVGYAFNGASRPDGETWLLTETNQGNMRVLAGDGASWSVIAEGGGRPTIAATEPDGTLWVGGSLFDLGDQGGAYLARLTTNCPATVSEVGTGCSSSVGPVAQAVEVGAWSGGIARARLTGAPGNALLVHTIGFAGQVLPLAGVLPQAGAGCTLWTTADLPLGPTLTGGGAEPLLVPIPAVAALVGADYRTQALVAELGQGGALTTVSVSNALRWTIGAFE